MKQAPMTMIGIAVAAVMWAAVPLAMQSGGTSTATLTKAAVVNEATNDQRAVLVPAQGQSFLWVSATLAGAPLNVDLTKVAVVSGASTFPLIGADSAWDGDPKQFSMIAPARLKDGRNIDPLEETRSVGGIGFAFTPGKVALLKVTMPPQSFCLLFSVPPTFRTGQVRGLGPKDLPLPTVATAPR